MPVFDHMETVKYQTIYENTTSNLSLLGVSSLNADTHVFHMCSHHLTIDQI